MAAIETELVPRIGSAKSHRMRDTMSGTALADEVASRDLVNLPVLLRDGGYLQARCRHVEACVSVVFRVPHEALRGSTRGKADVARARQVAMYVCNTTLGFSLTLIGVLFERDRTTVGHACRLVEDLRDEADFDALMICLERCVLAGCLGDVMGISVFDGGQTGWRVCDG